MANETKRLRFPAKTASAAVHGAADSETPAVLIRGWVAGTSRMKFETIPTNAPGCGWYPSQQTRRKGGTQGISADDTTITEAANTQSISRLLRSNPRDTSLSLLELKAKPASNPARSRT